jgi:hypothetical protein
VKEVVQKGRISKLIGITHILLFITVVSKIIGFIREMILLESVGISGALDSFLIIYGISVLVIGVIGICVVTNLTPVAHKNNSADQALEFLIEGVKVGLFAMTLAFVASSLYLLKISDAVSGGVNVFALCMILPITALFAIISEYQVALFLSRDQQIPVISGNLILSVPLIIAMLFFKVDIYFYSVGLVLTFGLRAAIFTFLLYRPISKEFSLRHAIRRKTMFNNNFLLTLSGGSAMLAVSFITLFALLVAQQFKVGDASLLGYGMKIPQLVLTSVWFVLGAKFFSQIVRDKGQNSGPKILRLTLLNLFLAISLGISVLLTNVFNDELMRFPLVANAEILVVFQRCLFFLPIIVFIPIIEMVQRTFVTLNRRKDVVPMALTICLTGGVGMAISYYFESIDTLIATISVATCFGAVIGLAKFRQLPAQFKKT